MAVRRVTHRYGSVVDFLEDQQGTLGKGAILLKPDAARGELAAELKLDLLVPPLGRLGPIPAQVVNRGSDGSVALRIAEWPPSVQARIDELLVAVADLRRWFGASSTPQPGSSLASTAQQTARATVSTATVSTATVSTATVSTATVSTATESIGAPAAPATPAETPAAGRGFAVPELAADRVLLKGSCDSKELRQLFLELATQHRTGVLSLRHPGGRVRYGFWSNGGPVGWRTDPVEEGELLGVLLYKAGQITKKQLSESLDVMQRTGRRQGDAFIEMGIMSFSQLVMVLGKQTEFVLQKVFGENVGRWTFHELGELPERFLPSPLRVPGMVFRTLFQQARAQRGGALFEALAPYLDQYVALPPASLDIMQELHFSAGEARLLEIIQKGSWRMRELYSVSPMSRAVTAAVMWALIDLDFVTFSSRQDAKRRNADLQTIIDRKKGQVFSGNHFDVLEVHWICIDEEVEAAYRRLKDEFLPSIYAQIGPAAVADIARINTKLDESYAALRSDTDRRAYRKVVVEQGKITDSAALLAKQGEMAILRHDRRAAVTCYGKAHELVPGHPDYRSGLIRSRGI